MRKIHDLIKDAILSWQPHQPARWSDAQLDALALPLFAHQFERNLPYQAYCMRQGVTPDTLTHFATIPAVSTDVFKHARLTSATHIQRTFHTSGTTQGARGAHHFGDLSVYAASLQAPFRRHLFPDALPCPLLILAPRAEHLPDSSLSYMLQQLCAAHPAPHAYFFEPDAQGALRLDVPALLDALRTAQAQAQPVALLGTAFAFMMLFDGAPDERFALPAGSRLMETGGFKGKSREVSRETLYTLFEQRLGVARTHCVSEYSMTELSSQAYTTSLWDAYHGEEVEAGASFLAPPWARIQVVDPVSFEVVERAGEVGLVRWFDLANTESVMMIQTADRGVLDAQGRVRLLGRDPGAQLRGCSLTVEELEAAGS